MSIWAKKALVVNSNCRGIFASNALLFFDAICCLFELNEEKEQEGGIHKMGPLNQFEIYIK